MIWTDKNYDYSATICRHTGKPCAALGRLAATLTQAVDKAVSATGPDFELDGAIAVNGCARDCRARFAASQVRTRLFCDVSEDAPQAALDKLADVMLGNLETDGFPAMPPAHVPCAMLQADRRSVHVRQTLPELHP
jgi:hypothetical protein